MTGLLAWIVVAVVTAEYFWWIVGAAAAAAAAWWLRRVHQRASAVLAECDAERLALLARADEQHAQCLAGDPRGVYGIYPPEVGNRSVPYCV